MEFYTLSCFNCCESCEHYHLRQVVYKETEGSPSDIEDEMDWSQESVSLIPDPENAIISETENTFIFKATKISISQTIGFKINDWMVVCLKLEDGKGK